MGSAMHFESALYVEPSGQLEKKLKPEEKQVEQVVSVNAIP